MAHYMFAHVALRDLAFAEPVKILGILASAADRVQLFDFVLGEMDARIGDKERRSFSSADILFSAALFSDRPCAILQMPPTRAPGEAYFVAIVGRFPVPDPGSKLEAKPNEALIDYYTLERTIPSSSEEQTVFASWSADGTHSNLGKGCKPSLEDFVSFLKQRSQGDPSTPET
jgi:hypothetical protein